MWLSKTARNFRCFWKHIWVYQLLKVRTIPDHVEITSSYSNSELWCTMLINSWVKKVHIDYQFIWLFSVCILWTASDDEQVCSSTLKASSLINILKPCLLKHIPKTRPKLDSHPHTMMQFSKKYISIPNSLRPCMNLTHKAVNGNWDSVSNFVPNVRMRVRIKHYWYEINIIMFYYCPH